MLEATQKNAICENQLTKCQLNKLRVVVINTGDSHGRVRQLIGSLHHHHKGDIKAVIYGLNLPPSKVSLILIKIYCARLMKFYCGNMLNTLIWSKNLSRLLELTTKKKNISIRICGNHS
jgi:hypothetical protein